MKQIFSALTALLLLTGCSSQPKDTPLTTQERTDLYRTAITAARDQELNDAIPVITDDGDESSAYLFELLGVEPQDMACYALSVSAMNVKAYAIAAIYPAAGKDDSVLEGLNTFVENQKQSFHQYLADQYEIASNARLETLEDGTVLLVMSENQDEVFDRVRDTIEQGQ